MSKFGIIAITPSHRAGQSIAIAIAAARAGGIGILDLEYAPAPVLPVVNELTNGAHGVCGIKCDIESLSNYQDALNALHAANGKDSNLVLLAPSTQPLTESTLSSAIELIHSFKLRAFIEITTIADGLCAQRAGADAIIAKGHEASGRVGDETSFILLQRCLSQLSLPIYVQGGIGLHTASACFVAGAAGVVLDSQLLLTRESELPAEICQKIACMDGSETQCLNGPQLESYRIYARPGASVLEKLQKACDEISSDSAFGLTDWRKAMRAILRSSNSVTSKDAVWLFGQDIAFASELAHKYCTVSGIIQAMQAAVHEHVAQAASLKPFNEGSPLAISHATRYPIVQGAMTRVSDTADFALQVAENGGLPFLALALMRAEEIEQLLKQTQNKLKDLSWGVGVLGFVPEQLRNEQMAVITRFKPPFALIAGGRPDQTKTFENLGIKTYLHVPSPLLLKAFIEQGSRRFIFEGKECGGHVGPRSSFVLWETMINVLLSSIGPRDDASAFHVLFAGGIHDDLSSAMVAAMAAPLAARGVGIGILMGTSYLFTKEAVQTGAIVDRFQQAALNCEKTVLLETGPGHSIRVIDSPYKLTFDQQRRQLESLGRSRDEVREELEMMNLGRLRIASKGLARAKQPTSQGLQTVAAGVQWSDGMYMIGQAAALHKECTTINALHQKVALGGTSLIEQTQERLDLDQKSQLVYTVDSSTPGRQNPEGIAIIGMSCFFPKANDLNTYWLNILNRVDAIEEIPAQQWPWENFYDQNPLARDKISSKWGGFLDPVTFEPTRYGIPPSSLDSIDPMQVLILESARAALADAGYTYRQFPKDRTSVILANAGHGPITALYSLRSMLDWKLVDLDASIKQQLASELPEWTEDSFAGYLGNVTAGRVANRFDLGGINFSIDAACASSLAALYVGVNELRAKTSDVILLAATDTHNQPGDYLSFSKTHALSQTGRCRTFDATADGIVISEGIAMLVLKRISDAERDGDRIYAVIRGVGGSSDGKDLSLTAPRPAGQMQALIRAYDNAGVSPSSVTLVEAHGTGTVAGDKAEIEALTRVFADSGAPKRYCAVGSVKTNIGHTKAAAGLASMIKIAKSLHHKVLPPTIGVTTPNPACNFPNSPFYINTELRPWMAASNDSPRRAGVSAFGFGGTNFHVVLEEYTGATVKLIEPVTSTWATELFLFRSTCRQELSKQIAAFEESIKRTSQNKSLALNKLAQSLHTRHFEQQDSVTPLTLAIIASSITDLLDKTERALKALSDANQKDIKDPRGIYFTESPLARDGQLAFLFPGQGSQQVNMLRDLSLNFPAVRREFERGNAVLAGQFDQALTNYIFPPPAFSEEETAAHQKELTDTSRAQPAVGVANLAMLSLLSSLGIKPDMVAGHSYGEYVALCAAGVITQDDLLALSALRGNILSRCRNGIMAAVSANISQVEPVIADNPGVTLANINSPNQCIIAGDQTSVENVIALLTVNGIVSKPIQVSAAFHSPHMSEAKDALSVALDKIRFDCPAIPVYSNTTASVYPQSQTEIKVQLKEHLVKPVDFLQEIWSMYAAGARIFVEVGPGAVLSNLVNSILQGEEHLALSTDRAGKQGLTQLQHTLGQLAVHGVKLDLSYLYNCRYQALEEITNNADSESTSKNKLSYLANSAKIWRAEQSVQVNTTATRQASTSPSLSDNKSQSSVSPAAQRPNNSANTIVAKHLIAAEQHKNGAQTQIKPSGSTPVSQHHIATSRDTSVDQVMLQFQQSMLQMTNNFIQAQQNVMLTYLKSTAGNDIATSAELEQLLRTMPTLPDGLNQLPAQQIQYQAISHPSADKHEHNGHNSAESRQSTGMAPEQPDNGSIVATANQQPIANESDVESLIAGLMEIVSQRTGYPPEMLDPELDLEADLGIDSIKRVEILSSFRKLLPESKLQELEGGIEKLAGTKTLQGIIDWIRSTSGPALSLDTAMKDPLTSIRDNVAIESLSSAKISRGHVVALELNPAMSAFSLTGTILITDDGQGVADNLSTKLRTEGHNVIVLRHASQTKELSQDCFTVDLLNPVAIQEVVDKIHHKHDSIHNLIHLVSLGTETKANLRIGEALDVRSLFLLLKALQPDLNSTSDPRQAVVISATRLGGSFGCTIKTPEGEQSPEFCYPASQGGVVGIIKTLAREWKDVRAKAVDFSANTSVEHITNALLSEITSDDQIVEIGYFNNRRLKLQVEPLVFLDPERTTLELDSSSVVLVTGGARGITAEIAIELAEKYKPTLIVIGRGPRPDGLEPADTAQLQSARDIKAAIMERMRQEGQKISIASVESIYQNLMREREIRDNLSQMEKSGSIVRYYALDVTDEEAFGGLVERLYDTFGRIDGVIHGAGVIEDAYIADKSLESFDRVYKTKVNGVDTIASTLKFDNLKFLLLFSSVVGRTGNAGQCDYVAANESMNKLALWLDTQTKGRVASIMWGPWRGGMAQPELESIFARYGWSMIDTNKGREAFINELTLGRKGDVEVLLVGQLAGATSGSEYADSNFDMKQTSNVSLTTGSDHHLSFATESKHTDAPHTMHSRKDSVSGARLCQASVSSIQPDITSYSLLLDPKFDLYLKDHQFDGIPVMPMAMSLELMAEAACDVSKHHRLTTVEQMLIPSGIVFDTGHKEAQVVVQSVNPKQLSISLNTGRTTSRSHFKAQFELVTDQNPSSVLTMLPKGITTNFEPPIFDRSEKSLSTVEEIYKNWMFHGPIFQGITRLISMGINGIAGELVPSDPAQCLKTTNGENWIIDPILLDSAMQLAGIWARHYMDITVLPTGFRRLQLVNSTASSKILTGLVIVPPESIEGELLCDLAIYDESGKLAILVEGLGGIGSRSFNRLAAQPRELRSVR